MKRKVAHLTSAHPRFDTRIFIKQCSSLSSKYETYLIVADGLGNATINDITIYDIGKFHSRTDRVLKAPKKVFLKALDIDADLYHLHDPELIPIGLMLKKTGKKVIFDSHEDIPNQILSKHYIHQLLKTPLSKGFRLFEKLTCSRFDAIITATPFIRDKFLKINSVTIDINNFPRIEELENLDKSRKVFNQVCYIGGLSDVRGIAEMVKAINITSTKSKLNLAGNFADPAFKKYIKSLPGWEQVNFLGFIGRDQVKKTLSTSIAGLVVLHPTQSYLDSLPVKMFEYMLAGLPVIASDFPYWRSIIEDVNCGLCIDPLNPEAIANAIDYFVNNPEIADTVGSNGKQAVIDKYNWSVEETKLLKLYAQLI